MATGKLMLIGVDSKMKRSRIPALALGAAALVVGIGPALAQYDYGGDQKQGGGQRGSGESGFVLLVELATTNPRNTDNVVATDLSGSTVIPIIPNWDNDFAGRLGLGWDFGNGTRILGSAWNFDTDASGAGSGSFGAAIGPPISDGSEYHGDVVGFFTTNTAIEASTFDLAWIVEHQMVEKFDLEWSVGLRHARFEESSEAFYDEAPAPTFDNSYRALKSNEGEMIGVRLGLAGRYMFFSSFSIGAGVAVSFLDGELNASSVLRPTGENNSDLRPGVSVLDDDSRSGRITEVDARVSWHHSSGKYVVWAGWEQSDWDDISADLMRNFPGTAAPLRDRDSVTFSGYKVGVRVRF
jgi:hypothetical protein